MLGKSKGNLSEENNQFPWPAPKIACLPNKRTSLLAGTGPVFPGRKESRKRNCRQPRRVYGRENHVYGPPSFAAVTSLTDFAIKIKSEGKERQTEENETIRFLKFLFVNQG
ncbi:hypothetical protein K0M31_012195 [Melipona bicolor]|uniref:Uncharacterized protein n=1 Tax=Melipona bicolor TaxID=60889 RepID=A0AA40FKI4_9HYME|nr:hypothetical protein K0M31_012195 [Melipona bicolor]